VTEKLLLTVPEVAERLGLGKSTIYALIASREIESVNIGRARRVPREAIDAFVARLRAETEDLMP
jgi:excisionase family DNA binding protein